MHPPRDRRGVRGQVQLPRPLRRGLLGRDPARDRRPLSLQRLKQDRALERRLPEQAGDHSGPRIVSGIYLVFLTMLDGHGNGYAVYAPNPAL